MIISKGAEKVFEKFIIFSWRKPLKKPEVEGTCLNVIKAIYDKPIANLILSGKTKIISLKSGMRQECSIQSTGVWYWNSKSKQGNKVKKNT
jgi:hypothetical protein